MEICMNKKELEEAAKKSASQYYVDGGYSPFPNVETAAHEAGFIAGAEWQKKLDDLETADLLAIAHLQGMEQQKSKMLEEAVEGEIQMRYSGCLCAKTIRSINEDKFKLGDKVRIIIVKEDEK